MNKGFFFLHNVKFPNFKFPKYSLINLALSSQHLPLIAHFVYLKIAHFVFFEIDLQLLMLQQIFDI